MLWESVFAFWGDYPAGYSEERNATGTVMNTEAGTPDACMIATYGFVPGQIVSYVERNGAIGCTPGPFCA